MYEGARMWPSKAYWLTAVAVLAPGVAALGYSGPEAAQGGSEPKPPAGEADAVLRPRLEVHVPSAAALARSVERSHAGVFLDPLYRLATARAEGAATGLTAAQAGELAARVSGWPDTSLHLLVYAPDRQGRKRWALVTSWPVDDLVTRIREVLDGEVTADFLEGVSLVAVDGGHRIDLRDAPLAYVLGDGDHASYLATHRDVPLPTERFTGTPETHADAEPLVVAKLDLTQTEQDTGATFLSSFSAVTDVVYAGRVTESGTWSEGLFVHWPPISGLGIKALFGRVKQTFFVPEGAFGALTLHATMLPGMVDGMAGFGPQMLREPGGGMAMVGEMSVGPVAAHADPQVCITVLPGTGFLPAPDIVVQSRIGDAEDTVEALREAAEGVNAALREREQAEPWHIETVRGRTVVWSDGVQQFPGMIVPLLMRPVLFTTEEADAEGKRRSFLVVGWTSTAPTRLVERWLDLPRGEGRYLPDRKKTSGQLRVDWSGVYRWVSPYLNLSLSTLSADALLPHVTEIESKLTDAGVTLTTGYFGMTAAHEGPLPVGVAVVPMLVTSAAQPDRSGGSDLARERLACQRLKVFYHHAKLFRKDIGRWPAELAELDGYIDFEGHPYLLELNVSSRKRLGEWFDSLFGDDEEERAPEDEAEAVFVDIDESKFRIEWSRDAWRLGVAPGVLEHLEALYIDESGRIHRVEKNPDQDQREGAEGSKEKVAEVAAPAAGEGRR